MSTDFYNFAEMAKEAAVELQPLPKGDYQLFVKTAEPKQSANGKLMFFLNMQVVGGPHNGRTIFHNIVLTVDNPNALRMFFVNMAAFGLTPEYFAGNPQPAQIAAQLLNKTVTATIDHRLYQGQTRDNIKSLKPSAGGGVPGLAAAAITAPAPAPAPAPVTPPAPAAPAPVAPPAAAVPAPAPAETAPAPAPAQEAQTEATAPSAAAPVTTQLPPPAPF